MIDVAGERTRILGAECRQQQYSKYGQRIDNKTFFFLAQGRHVNYKSQGKYATYIENTDGEVGPGG